MLVTEVRDITTIRSDLTLQEQALVTRQLLAPCEKTRTISAHGCRKDVEVNTPQACMCDLRLKCARNGMMRWTPFLRVPALRQGPDDGPEDLALFGNLHSHA